MPKYCVSENLDELKDILKNGTIFNDSLKLSNFLVILEIVWNAVNNKKKRCKKCFSSKTLKKLKNHRKILKYIFSKKKSLEERKLKFLKSKKSFKSLVKRLLKEFMLNALEVEKSI